MVAIPRHFFDLLQTKLIENSNTANRRPTILFMATSPGSGAVIPPPHQTDSVERAPFPQLVDDFESDPRVSFSKLDNNYILEDDDGSEWEWQPAVGADAQAGKGRWVQSVSAQRHTRGIAGEARTIPMHIIKIGI